MLAIIGQSRADEIQFRHVNWKHLIFFNEKFRGTYVMKKQISRKQWLCLIIIFYLYAFCVCTILLNHRNELCLLATKLSS